MRLTGLGWGALIGGLTLVAIGVAFGFPACTAIGALCVALVVAGMAMVVEAPRLTVGRIATPPEVQRGTPAAVQLTLRSSSRRRRPLTLIERVGGVDRAARIGALGGEAHVIDYPVDTSQRGVVVSGPLVARRGDPFGLVGASRRFGGTCSVRIRPRVLPLRMLPSGRQRDFEGPTRERSEGTASFHQIREYQMGDDLRRVHWRTTARTGSLMVKQMVDTTRPELVVVLDNRQVAIGPDDFEEAVDVAATLLHAADDEGFPTTLLFSADQSPVGQGDTVPHIDRLTDVRLSDTDSLLALSEQIVARGRSLVFVTGELIGPDLLAVGRLATGFHPAVLVSVAAERTMPVVPPPGVRALACASAVDFTAEWRATW